MNHASLWRSPQTIAVVGNSLPRRCGIATFTSDLVKGLASETPDLQFWTLAVNDLPDGYAYPSEVRFEINEKALTDYRLAADYLNMTHVDVVCLQHEFGIFGGDCGSHVLDLVRNVRMPVVTTFHTILTTPSPKQKAILEEIARISERVVVMSCHARNMLESIYDVSPHKIVHIPHGIPDVPFVDPNFYKDQFGVEGRKVILTFGLVSPGKGLEQMIDALPDVVRKHPEAVYIILGATHPHIKREQGESYRLGLQRQARELGVQDHIIFHNRFVDLTQLCEFLGATDVYVTPYLSKEQVVSGTLAYALGAGKAAVSTPYWYAEEMLAEGRGRLTPFEDSGALAEQIIGLFDNETERHAMRKRAYTFCRNMIWKEVARRYLEVFAEARETRENHPRTLFRIKTLKVTPFELPQVKLDHLLRLTDDVGILQHAKFGVPDRSHGYCTDDNARALIAVMLARKVASEPVAEELAYRYLSFLHHAFNEKLGQFRNFLTYDRQWTEDSGSDDSNGRAIWSLGAAVALADSDSLLGVSLHLFEKALPMVLDLPSPRSWAFALVGIDHFLRRFSGDSGVKRTREKLATQLFMLYETNATDDWPWIEETATYANGKIPQALLSSGQWMQSSEMTNAGLRSLEWLLGVQTDSKGHFAPIGNRGWYERGGSKARFDQQPIEAQNLIEACIEAFNVTQDNKWILEAQRCLEWFLGRNDVGVALYDYRTGGCCDGLTSNGANQNQGAESTLAWLLSLLNVYSLRELQSGSLGAVA